MSEYDCNLVFVPLRELQRSRGMIDPETGVGKFTSIQIKLRPGANPEQVRDKLRDIFPAQFYSVTHLARTTRSAVGRRANGNDGAQYPVVHDYCRGGIWHPGDLFHDRGGEDSRYRHPEIAGRLELGHHGDLS